MVHLVPLPTTNYVKGFSRISSAQWVEFQKIAYFDCTDCLHCIALLIEYAQGAAVNDNNDTMFQSTNQDESNFNYAHGVNRRGERIES